MNVTIRRKSRLYVADIVNPPTHPLSAKPPNDITKERNLDATVKIAADVTERKAFL